MERGSTKKTIGWVVAVFLICCAAGFGIIKKMTPKEVVITEVEEKTIVLQEGKCHETKRFFNYTGAVDTLGLPHGYGHAEYPETLSSKSCKFTGTFEHGVTKEGEMTFANNTKYKGTFTEDGSFNEGTWWEADGYYFTGTFKKGDPYNGTWYTPTGKVDDKVVNGK